jgi:hypothetical protein
MYTIKNMTTKTDWTDSGPVTTYNFDFGFIGKEQYLEETAGWKAEYRELSQRIRLYKTYRKPSLCPDNIGAVYSTLGTMQQQARQMCQMRVQAKAEAGRQMVAQRMAA